MYQELQAIILYGKPRDFKTSMYFREFGMYFGEKSTYTR